MEVILIFVFVVGVFVLVKKVGWLGLARAPSYWAEGLAMAFPWGTVGTCLDWVGPLWGAKRLDGVVS